MRRLHLVLLSLALVAVGFLLFQASFRYFQQIELRRADGRAALYQSSLTEALNRFEHLPYVLSQDPMVQKGVIGGADGALNVRLQVFAERSGLDAIYLMDTSGLTVAASNHAQPTTFLGKNYGFRPYFLTALEGGQGTFYGIGATTGQPGYFIADPVRDEAGDIRGVIALKLDLGSLEESWADGGEEVLLVNRDGIVLLASDPVWRYQTLAPLTDQQRAEIAQSQQFRNQPLHPLDLIVQADQQARFDGQDVFLIEKPLPGRDWRLVYLADAGPVQTRASAVVLIAGGAFLAGFAIWLALRSRRIGLDLKASRADSAALREANARLEAEIEERRTAERRLARTQGELERASRLAVLGKLATSVTHELGQPIAAMRNYITAAEMADTPKKLADSLPRFASLVTRMQHITEQLRFFARPGSDQFEPVDILASVEAALDLLAPNLEQHKVQVSIETPAVRVLVRGNRLRLEQVLTNIMRNAVDAMADSAKRYLTVSIEEVQDQAVLSVKDTGPGLGDSSLETLQEPFFTTKASGEGMGLGLAISMEIVAEHGGTMQASTQETGGACLKITLPLEAEMKDVA